jgi:hypothetical protein
MTDDGFVKKRLERDLTELKRMCDDHFKKRADDEELLGQLEGRMSDRQKVHFSLLRSMPVHGGSRRFITVLGGRVRSNAVFGGP